MTPLHYYIRIYYIVLNTFLKHPQLRVKDAKHSARDKHVVQRVI